MPGIGTPCLLNRASIRRWRTEPFINESTIYLKRRRGKSVYLRSSTGYLDKTPPKDVFSRITLKCFGSNLDELFWIGYQSKLFQLLDLDGNFPTVAELGADPAKYTDKMLMPIENRESKTHEVATGLFSSDHRDIFTDLNKHFAEWTVPLETWHRPPEKKRRSLTGKREQSILGVAKPACIELHLDDAKIAKEQVLIVLGVHAQYKDRLDEDPLYVMDGEQPLLEIVEGKMPELTGPLPKAPSRNYYFRTFASSGEIGRDGRLFKDSS